MLAFTFPGQGSQRPGMGRPWRDHESWELVDEATDIAGRDVARTALRRRRRRTQGHAQRAAHHIRVEPDGARRRRTARASSRATAPATASASTPRSRPPVRSASTTASDSSRARARRCTTPGSTSRARWPRSSVSTTIRSSRLPTRRRRRLGRQLQRTRPGRHRRLARRRRAARRRTPRNSAPSGSCRCRSPARSTRRS